MLNSDYRDMLSLLVKHDVEFMLIGAYALAVHGVPRSTGDINFFVEWSWERQAPAWAFRVNAGNRWEVGGGKKVPVLGFR